jgi:thiol-disulfide isomerase/thioredoxin
MWVIGIIVLALAGTIIVAMMHKRSAQRAAVAAATTAAAAARPVPAQVLGELENIPDSTWERADAQKATAPVFAGDTDSANGKPVVLYIGAGFCPYCAAARWPMIVALSRFGKFSGLSLGSSSPTDVFANTPTFSFYKSSYSSEYIDFQPVEEAGEVQGLDGRYAVLERPTPAQQALLEKYDAPPYVPAASAGGIPFVLVGGKYTWSGSPFDPGVLSGKSQAAIAASLASGTGDAAVAILANANEFTASICAVDGGKPANVCASPAVQRAMHSLPTKPR